MDGFLEPSLLHDGSSCHSEHDFFSMFKDPGIPLHAIVAFRSRLIEFLAAWTDSVASSSKNGIPGQHRRFSVLDTWECWHTHTDSGAAERGGEETTQVGLENAPCLRWHTCTQDSSGFSRWGTGQVGSLEKIWGWLAGPPQLRSWPLSLSLS